MKYDFANKVVLITGGTGAIGRAVAKAFLASDESKAIHGAAIPVYGLS